MYDHILSVIDTKRYLRIEPDFTDDDQDLERMIASAFGYIEKQTNHIFRPQDKTYYKSYSNHINVYDHPVNTTTYPDNALPHLYPGFIRFCSRDSITLNVGYTSKDNAPSELIDCALQMIKVWYYEAEKNVNTTLLPENVKQIIDTNRRFIAC
ncbi:head-tail connector protein [Chryseobacterium arthrosphaerae]